MVVVGEMKQRRFGMQNQVVAGVIEALLMVALVSIVLSVVQLVYIPQVMEQRESEHMDLVSNQVSSLKSMIDLQGMTKSSAPISSMITLGSKELPYFVSVKAFGEVSVKEDPNYKISLLSPPAGLPLGVIPLTSIQYAADNSYFVDQTYILAGGGLIVQQPDGNPVMRADPSISSTNNTNSISINFDLTHVLTTPEKNLTSGDGNCFIRTNYSSNKTYYNTIQPGGHIQIYTRYLNAWNQSIFSLLGSYEVNGYIHIDIPPTKDYLEITPGSKYITIKLNVIDIYVQIGQGWIL